MRSHSGPLGTASPYSQAFAPPSVVCVRNDPVWERGGPAIAPEWASDGDGRYRPVRR
jgi:hypothetical protein